MLNGQMNGARQPVHVTLVTVYGALLPFAADSVTVTFVGTPGATSTGCGRVRYVHSPGRIGPSVSVPSPLNATVYWKYLPPSVSCEVTGICLHTLTWPSLTRL